MVVIGAHMHFTASFCAPSYQRIVFDFFFGTEAHVLFEQCGIALANNTPHELNVDGKLTLVIKALDFVELGALNVLPQRSDGTFYTESMLACKLDGALVDHLSSLRDRVCIADLTIFLFFDLYGLRLLDKRFLLFKNFLSCIIDLLVDTGCPLNAVLTH